jgi:hypothetical protein
MSLCRNIQCDGCVAVSHRNLHEELAREPQDTHQVLAIGRGGQRRVSKQHNGEAAVCTAAHSQKYTALPGQLDGDESQHKAD